MNVDFYFNIKEINFIPTYWMGNKKKKIMK